GVPDVTFDGVAAYSLSVELQNRTAARSAGTVIPYDTAHTGTLYADDPMDYWLFEGTVNDIITIDVVSDGVLEPALTLIPSNAPIENGQSVPASVRTGTTIRPARLVEY